jgi:hypothetical protein
MGWASTRKSREGGRDAIFDRFPRASPIQCDCCPRSTRGPCSARVPQHYPGATGVMVGS